VYCTCARIDIAVSNSWVTVISKAVGAANAAADMQLDNSSMYDNVYYAAQYLRTKSALKGTRLCFGSFCSRCLRFVGASITVSILCGIGRLELCRPLPTYAQFPAVKQQIDQISQNYFVIKCLILEVHHTSWRNRWKFVVNEVMSLQGNCAQFSPSTEARAGSSLLWQHGAP
jgi:hypothetical protein